MTSSVSDVRARLSEAVEDVLKPRVKLLAVDFDMTLVSTHTNSRYKGSPLALAKLARPQVKHLIREALRAKIKVGIVTFSNQHNLIRSVLHAAFGPEAAEKIRIKCHDDTWNVSLCLFCPFLLSKCLFLFFPVAAFDRPPRFVEVRLTQAKARAHHFSRPRHIL